jgi:hypothetical protein
MGKCGKIPANRGNTMRKQMFAVKGQVVLFVILAAFESYAETTGKQIPVKPAGETVLAAEYPGLVIQIKIATHEVDIGKPGDRHPEAIKSSCTYSRYPCSVVDGIEIGVNGKALFVPRSVFSDRADLNGAEIRPDKDGVVLVLSGGDASESYELRITFDAEHVTGRTLISGEFGDVLQKTTYFQSQH